MISLPNLAVIHFSGEDAGEFLHNQFSADVLGLTAGQSAFACYCEPSGRVLSLMLVCRHSQGFFVIMSRALTSSIAKRLKIYVLRSSVTIEVLDETTVYGLCKDDGADPAPSALAAFPLPGSDGRLTMMVGGAVTAGDAAERDAWRVSELQRGITWMCPETSGQFLPQMLGFDTLGAVNYRKGCYPGQEIVARTHYLGKVKRHPRLLCTSAIFCPDPLDKIQIFSGEVQHDAIIVDCGHRQDGASFLYTVTRMDPELNIDRIEYRGQICPVG